MLKLIGLTAGEAFVVAYIAGFIITAPYWPRLGAWLLLRLTSKGQTRPSEK